jgi:hypothetical protein
MSDVFQKLRREWKTFAWGLLCLSIDLYDLLVQSGVDFPALFPPEHQPWIRIVQISGFFLLRRWRDHVEPIQLQSNPPQIPYV